MWCYTTDPNKKYDYCEHLKESDIEGLWGDKGNRYKNMNWIVSNFKLLNETNIL
jgi:hypothetical protein